MQTFDAVLFDLFGTLVNEDGSPIDGASELLEAMPAQRFAIVTSCPRRLADALIERAGLRRPPVVVTADDVRRGKPAPDCYLAAAARLGVVPERCLVIEDSPHGAAAGTAAGMNVVTVYRDVPSLRACGLSVASDGAILRG
jgi:sugar-phosphatase